MDSARVLLMSCETSSTTSEWARIKEQTTDDTLQAYYGMLANQIIYFCDMCHNSTNVVQCLENIEVIGNMITRIVGYDQNKSTLPQFKVVLIAVSGIAGVIIITITVVLFRTKCRKRSIGDPISASGGV